jgi:AraC family transcriptional activator of pobA
MTAPHFSAAPLFSLQPLAVLRRELPPGAFARWQQYVVVLAEDAGAAGPTALYVSSPGQLALAGVPAQAQGQVLRFSPEFVGLAAGEQDLLLDHLFYQPGARLALPVPGEQAAELAFLLASLRQQQGDAAPLRDALLRAYLHTLLLCCLRVRQRLGRAGSPPPSLFLRFRQLLEQRYTVWKSVADYASHLRVTANHLSTAVRKETGQPASTYIRQRIMLEAQRLVARRNVPLKEVAYRLGFEDVSHFSKLFKRATGSTFSSFKASVWAQYGGRPVLAAAGPATFAQPRPQPAAAPTSTRPPSGFLLGQPPSDNGRQELQQ